VSSYGTLTVDLSPPVLELGAADARPGGVIVVDYTVNEDGVESAHYVDELGLELDLEDTGSQLRAILPAGTAGRGDLTVILRDDVGNAGSVTHRIAGGGVRTGHGRTRAGIVNIGTADEDEPAGSTTARPGATARTTDRRRNG
jgi:hypothetical protein